MNLYEWALRHGITPAAVSDLKQLMGTLPGSHIVDPDVTTEFGASRAIRFEAAQKGILMWRNNVGAYLDDHGNMVRYGLANETKQMNQNVKSSDLIGIKPNGQFVAREVKKPGWRYTGTARESAQLKFIELIISKGGDAAFATGEGTL